jgi:hypothetical protein
MAVLEGGQFSDGEYLPGEGNGGIFGLSGWMFTLGMETLIIFVRGSVVENCMKKNLITTIYSEKFFQEHSALLRWNCKRIFLAPGASEKMRVPQP